MKRLFGTVRSGPTGKYWHLTVQNPCPDPKCGWSHTGEERLEEAWGIIANASDWDNPERQEWRRAAERFRDWTYPGSKR